MTRTFLTLLFLTMVSVAQPPPGARFVRVNVIVRDANGPVAGLTKDDFAIFDNGRPREIASFEVSSTLPAGKPPEPLPPGNFTNRMIQSGGAGGVTVVMFDALDTPIRDQDYAASQFAKFLSGIRPEDHVMVCILGDTLSVSRAQNGDVTQPLREALATGVAPAPASMGEYAVSMFHLADTQVALLSIARILAPFSGRKNLVWVSASFPFGMDAKPGDRSNSNSVGNMIRILAAADFAVYPVDAWGLVAKPDEFAEKRRFVKPQYPRRLTPEAMESLAIPTGGLAFYTPDDIPGSLRRVLADNELTYSLGFHANASDLDSRYHELKVEVRRPGAELRYRQGYWATPVVPLSSNESQWEVKQTLRSPLEFPGIGLKARLTTIEQPKPGSHQIALRIDPADVQVEKIDGLWKGSIEVAFAKRAWDGKDLGTDGGDVTISLTNSQYEQVKRDGFVITKSYEPDLELAAVRIVVLDNNTGLVGSLTVPLAP